MTSQSCTSSERLLAVGIRALVRTLPRVDSPMASKRARITEFLCNLLASHHPEAMIIIYLAATIAHVRFLTSVNSNVDSESRPLNELLPAVWPITSVRPHTSMDPFYIQSDSP